MVSAVEHGLPLAAVAALWFASTALVVWLDSRPANTFGRSLVAAGLVATAALATIAVTAGDDSVAAAYLSFVAGLAIWGWHELAFLTGVVGGPRRAPCPPGARGWDRFRLATATVIHHEVALALTALLLLSLTWGQPNAAGAHAFALLFALRLSAKLNIFLGVPSFADELMPPHLGYLRSYFGKPGLNPLLPLSFALALGAAAWFALTALGSDGGAAVADSLLFGLAALGALEHLFLMMPLGESALWRWARAGGERPN